MGKKSIHKATKQRKQVKTWDSIVRITSAMIEKGYPSKVIEFVIKVAELILIVKKLLDTFSS